MPRIYVYLFLKVHGLPAGTESIQMKSGYVLLPDSHAVKDIKYEFSSFVCIYEKIKSLLRLSGHLINMLSLYPTGVFVYHNVNIFCLSSFNTMYMFLICYNFAPMACLVYTRMILFPRTYLSSSYYKVIVIPLVHRVEFILFEGLL